MYLWPLVFKSYNFDPATVVCAPLSVCVCVCVVLYKCMSVFLKQSSIENDKLCNYVFTLNLLCQHLSLQHYYILHCVSFRLFPLVCQILAIGKSLRCATKQFWYAHDIPCYQNRCRCCQWIQSISLSRPNSIFAWKSRRRIISCMELLNNNSNHFALSESQFRVCLGRMLKTTIIIY